MFSFRFLLLVLIFRGCQFRHAFLFSLLVLIRRLEHKDGTPRVVQHVVADRSNEEFANSTLGRGCQNDGDDIFDERRLFNQDFPYGTCLRLVRNDVDDVRESRLLENWRQVILNPLYRGESLRSFLCRDDKTRRCGQNTLGVPRPELTPRGRFRVEASVSIGTCTVSQLCVNENERTNERDQSHESLFSPTCSSSGTLTG